MSDTPKNRGFERHADYPLPWWLRQFVDAVAAGSLRLPTTATRSVEWQLLLLDSLVMGYPIGVVVLREANDIYEVVDGVARLRTIVDALTLPNLGWDLRAGCPVVVSKPWHLPFCDTRNAVALFRAAEKMRKIEEAFANRAESVAQRIVDATVPVIRVFGTAADVTEMRRRLR